jgi:microcystin-dependent protein
MSDPFVAEIRIFGFNFAPRGWAFCDGQILPISQNTALFSLLGTTYGGDGRSTFGLPNLQDRSPLHWGQGPGLSYYDLGEEGGAAAVTLLESEMPNHGHTLNATAFPAASRNPAGNALARSRGDSAYQTNSSQNLAALHPSALALAGGSQPHNNLMPSLVLNFCIAMQGVFPPRP